jgi:hypothetical protein
MQVRADIAKQGGRWMNAEWVALCRQARMRAAEAERKSRWMLGSRCEGESYVEPVCPEPTGSWEYEVELGDWLRYSGHAWPFYARLGQHARLDLGLSDRLRPAWVHLAPSTEWRSWHNQYVWLAIEPKYGWVHVSMSLYLRPERVGGRILHAGGQIDLNSLWWSWTAPVPAEYSRAVNIKRAKVLRFLRNACKERDAGRPAPRTAEDRYHAARTMNREGSV